MTPPNGWSYTCPGAQLWLWSRPVSAPACPRCASVDGHHPLSCWAVEFAARDGAAAV